MEGVEVLLGILRDAWSTMFGLPTSTLDLVTNVLGGILGFFVQAYESISKIIDLLQNGLG